MIACLNDPIEEGKQPLSEGPPDHEDIVVMVSLSPQERALYDYMDQKTDQVFVRILRRRQSSFDFVHGDERIQGVIDGALV